MPTPAFSTIAAIADVLGLSLDAVWVEVNPPAHGAEATADDRLTPERSALEAAPS